MTQKQYLGLIGFGFVVAWIALGFGYALLCVVGAAVFYAAGGIALGEVDLGDLQDRLRAPRGGGAAAAPSAFRRAAGAPPRVR